MVVRRCPKCKSTSIDIDSGIITGLYHCRSCGLLTPMILEEQREKK